MPFHILNCSNSLWVRLTFVHVQFSNQLNLNLGTATLHLTKLNQRQFIGRQFIAVTINRNDS